LVLLRLNAALAMVKGAYSQGMADQIILVEMQDHVKEAGKSLRTAYNMLVDSGMVDNAEYRQLETRLTVALAMVEGVYSEARRRSDM
jgi:hypothetical protein